MLLISDNFQLWSLFSSLNVLLHPCVLPRVPAGVVPAGSVPAVESADVGNLNSTKGKTERREGGLQWGLHDMALTPAVDGSRQLVWSKEKNW